MSSLPILVLAVLVVAVIGLITVLGGSRSRSASGRVDPGVEPAQLAERLDQADRLFASGQISTAEYEALRSRLLGIDPPGPR